VSRRKPGEQTDELIPFEVPFRQSKIGNPKSKMAGHCFRCRIRNLWSGSSGAAAEEVSRIGYLTGTSLSANPARTDAFRQGLRQLGYVDGKNIVIE